MTPSFPSRRSSDRAGKTPDTMFINDDLARPAQTVAGVDHGLGERVGLVLVKRQRRRRGKESGKMHIRIAAGDNIFNDATQGGGIQSVSIDTLPEDRKSTRLNSSH